MNNIIYSIHKMGAGLSQKTFYDFYSNDYIKNVSEDVKNTINTFVVSKKRKRQF
jgi:hypothetical protein